MTNVRVTECGEPRGKINEALRLRHLGEDIVALSRQPLRSLGDVAVWQVEPYTVDKAVVKIEKRRHQHCRIESVVTPAGVVDRSGIGLSFIRAGLIV